MTGYVSALVTSLDQEASGESSASDEIVIGGITGVLKKSLEDSGVKVELPSEIERRKRGEQNSDKEHLIEAVKGDL